MKNSDFLISVIIPVYNAVKYIDNCISSVLKQDEQDFEVLLIDDGSTDGSSERCDFWGGTDTRIKVVHQQNAGVSAARNAGLEIARGKWVAFIDADDEVTPQFLTIHSELSDCDIIQKGYIERCSSEDKVCNVPDKLFYQKNSIRKQFVRFRNNALWDKLISRKLIGDTRFNTDLRIGEDLVFQTSLYHNVSKWAYSSIGKYIYYKRDQSVMASAHRTEQIVDSYFKISDHLLQLSALTARKWDVPIALIAEIYLPLIYYKRRTLSKPLRDKMRYYISNIGLRPLAMLSTRHKVRHAYILLGNMFSH